MKSEGVEDILKWLEGRCKLLKKELDESRKDRGIFGDDYFTSIDGARLEEAVNIKISVEKYMKKLRHEGQ